MVHDLICICMVFLLKRKMASDKAEDFPIRLGLSKPGPNFGRGGGCAMGWGVWGWGFSY